MNYRAALRKWAQQNPQAVEMFAARLMADIMEGSVNERLNFIQVLEGQKVDVDLHSLTDDQILALYGAIAPEGSGSEPEKRAE